jgi:pSer/pThr/pTyr-binding forkhead associated (FHA) protein
MVSDQLLLVLKLCLLALLYLFFFRVVRAVWAELRPVAPVPIVPTGTPLAAAAPRRRRKDGRTSTLTRQFVIVEPIELVGRTYPLDGEVSIGRAAGCQITLDDTYASQIHARVFRRDDQWQIEDLGSTNGTWLNRHKVAGPMVVKPGDVVQIGNTVLELQ